MDQISSVEERISNSLDRLSPKHKQMARFVLDNRYFVSYSSASQVGAKNDTSAATVVRFAQAIGYEGYSELQDAMRIELPNVMTAAERMQARLIAHTPQSSTPQQIFLTDIQNIERTAASLPETSLNFALDTILKARNIYVIGGGLSAGPVLFLAHSLKVMGFNASGVLGEGLQATVDLARMSPEDLLIAIDLWRYVRMTVNSAAQAKEKHARVIAITDSIVSPLAHMSDITLEVSTQGTAHSQSIVAILSLFNVLIAMLADRVPEQVFQTLHHVDNAYRGNDLLIMR